MNSIVRAGGLSLPQIATICNATVEAVERWLDLGILAGRMPRDLEPLLASRCMTRELRVLRALTLPTLDASTVTIGLASPD